MNKYKRCCEKEIRKRPKDGLARWESIILCTIDYNRFRFDAFDLIRPKFAYNWQWRHIFLKVWWIQVKCNFANIFYVIINSWFIQTLVFVYNFFIMRLRKHNYPNHNFPRIISHISFFFMVYWQNDHNCMKRSNAL